MSTGGESVAGSNFGDPLQRHRDTMKNDHTIMVHVAYPFCLLPIHFAPHLTAHPLKWWAERGGFAPLLQAAAQRVLCIPATAAANERIFSSFKHIWSNKRSSLLLGRMWLLAFIYFNKRVLERRPKPQPAAEWQQFAQWMKHMPVEA
ncbi:hypothetical protein QJQ45_003111 [Haematococcus lacustris]|nr:hypothetical protein QJQ45_003111 [Haematococcus lacustris]